MAPEGISVAEINLNLANACYYLCWTPAASLDRPEDRRNILDNIHVTARQLEWKVFATGIDAGGVHLLFRTRRSNLDTGLSVVLRKSDRHRLYLVQPDSSLERMAVFIKARHDVDIPPNGAPDNDDTDGPPDSHYGLFMGGRSWADQMLGLLTRCAAGAEPDTGRGDSLTQIARLHADKREAIAEAYRSGGFTLKDIAEHFDMHFSEVSAVVNAAMAKP